MKLKPLSWQPKPRKNARPPKAAKAAPPPPTPSIPFKDLKLKKAAAGKLFTNRNNQWVALSKLAGKPSNKHIRIYKMAEGVLTPVSRFLNQKEMTLQMSQIALKELPNETYVIYELTAENVAWSENHSAALS